MSEMPPLPSTPPATPSTLPPGTPLKPGSGWYVVGGLMIALSLAVPAVAGGMMLSGFFDIVGRGRTQENGAISTSLPGECEIDLPQAGRYQVLHQYAGTFGGEHFKTEPFLPGLTASLVWADTGEAVTLHPMTDFVKEGREPGNEYTNKLEMWRFETSRPGKLTLAIECEPGGGLPDRAVFVVDEMFEADVFFGGFSRMFLVMPIVGLLGTGMLVGGILVIVMVSVKRSRYRSMLIEGHAA